jgi:hypothetical protein
MAGVHLQLECTPCHRSADAEVLPEGAHRYLGLQRDCASCHQDPHQGRMQLDCTTCHGQDSFQRRDVAGHERFLLLEGPHAQAACRECHAESSPHALERMRPDSARQGRACADCHESPHAESFLRCNAEAVRKPAKAVCGTCHGPELLEFRDARAMLTADQHVHSGFPLAAPHTLVSCSQCHPDDADYAARHPGRSATDCRACHADPHGGQFESGPFAGSCMACHAQTGFVPHEFDREHHARTSFPLDGKHVAAECRQCHPDPIQREPRRFAGTRNRCEQCHEDAHAGAFAHQAQELAKHPRGTCATCHGTGAFAELDHAAFDHARMTAFAVTGAHAQIDCTDCHPRAETRDTMGRRFGRIERHGERFGGCATCHQDPHEGQFDADSLPAVVDDRRGCERCHDSSSFRAVRKGFDHGTFTGFPLTGGHAPVPCGRCHAPLPAPSATGRTSARAAGKECSVCHQDPHQGQFERFGRTDCARCHRSTTSFGTLSFRHNLDSRFQLGDAHARVPCAECHREESIQGKVTTRYRPLPIECVACHGATGAPPRRRGT